MSSDNESPNASTSPLQERAEQPTVVVPVPLPRSVLRDHVELPRSLEEIKQNVFD